MPFASRRAFTAGILGGSLSIALTGGLAAADRRLRFGYQRSSTLLTILKEQQVLERTLGAGGWQVAWSLFGSVLEPMNAGSVDFHADVADAVPVFTQAAGAPLTFYAREDPSPSAEALIVHDDSPVRAVIDLKGRTVGVSRGSGAHFLLAALLNRHGLSFHDIRPAYLPSAEGFAAFQGRNIDAWVIWDPFLAITQGKMPVRVIADGAGVTSYFRYYLVNDSFVAAHPEVVQTVFDALVDAAGWLKSNPRAAAELLAPLWGDVPVATVEAVNSRRSHVVKPVRREDLSEQQQIADTFFDAGLIPRKLAATDVRIWRPSQG
jgi:sulfonate transport system substrate-binding protein